MSRPTSSSSSSSSRASTEDELTELRARVASLEAEVSRRRTSTSARSESTSSRRSTTRQSRAEDTSDVVDRAADAFGRKFEESSRLIRALVLTGLEPLRITADATLGFVDEITERAEGHDDETVGDLVTSLPRDVYSGFARAMDRAADAIPDTVDTFHERFREARPLRLRRGSRQTSATSRTTTGVVPHVISTRPASGSTSSSAPDQITVTFNTEIQPKPVEFGSSIVVRKESVVVPGTESQTSTTTLGWKPAAPLTPGAYTVGVYNVESAEGAAMSEPFYFSFSTSS